MREYRLEENDTIHIVPINQNYSYEKLKQNMNELKRAYPFLEMGRIGYSVLGKEIPYIRIGKWTKEVLYHAGIHANEWITSILLMKFIEEFCNAYIFNERIYGVNAQYLFENVSLYIVPMVNPDGIDLVTGNVEKNSSIYQNYLDISREFPNVSFPDGWKANFNGVDLNLQFPAEWNRAKEIKYAQGFTKPAPRDFVGEGPLTQPESLALYNFTLEHNFNLTISYHTQGEEIYWQFLDYNPPDSKRIGTVFARVSGYRLAEVTYNSSFAGYKDWFIQNYNRPGYTVEAGLGENPLPISQFSQIYQENEPILVYGMLIQTTK